MSDVTYAVHVKGHARPFVYGAATLWSVYHVFSVADLMKHLRERCRDYWFKRELDVPGAVKLTVLEVRHVPHMHRSHMDVK